VVILIGYLGRRWGLIPLGFVGPANRVVFYIGIPALLLKAIMGAPVREILNPPFLACFVISPPLVWLFALAFVHWGRISKGRARGSFLQGAVHGNLGYVGLAVTLYVLGEEGIRLAGVVIGFLIITQNVLGVLSLTFYSAGASRRGVSISLITNPIIIACFSGLLISSDSRFRSLPQGPFISWGEWPCPRPFSSSGPTFPCPRSGGRSRPLSPWPPSSFSCCPSWD